MSWGGLNPALTAWREGINARFPGRDTSTDGGYADAAHGSTSQHQPDTDGTVDAFDMDANLLRGTPASGTDRERQLIEALKLDFQADSRAQLWIHQRRVANRDVDSWRRRQYSGKNPHDKHVHWQSRQSRERDGSPWKFTHTDALLNGDDDMAEITQARFSMLLAQGLKDAAKVDPIATVMARTDSATNRQLPAVATELARANAMLGELIGRPVPNSQEIIRGVIDGLTLDELIDAVGDRAEELKARLSGEA